MHWQHLDIVAFDTETTGLDPYSIDRVVEVALVVFRLDGEGQVVSTHEVSHLVDPEMPIPAAVTRLTGLRDEDVRGKPKFHEIAAELAETFDGAVGVAHNVPFDLGFLTHEFARAGVAWREPIALIDTVDVSMKHFPEARSHKLGDVTKRMGIRLVGAHRATNDAEACGRVFVDLARKHEVPDDLQALLDWANAIGRPPEDGPLGADPYGTAIFLEGPHAGEPVADHPLHLAWMTKAKVRAEHGWAYRFAESTRRWAARWLQVRGAGRARQHPKSFRPDDWTLDCCIAESRLDDGSRRTA